MSDKEKHFIKAAIELAGNGIKQEAGGPFGAVIVKDNKIISQAFNQVTSTNDPTAHAEVLAIREACKKLNTFNLEGCDIYTSCEPCPMCLGAIYWAHIEKVYFACTRVDAAKINFDDQFIYDEIEKDPEKRKINFTQIGRKEALKVFENWDNKKNKVEY